MKILKSLIKADSFIVLHRISGNERVMETRAGTGVLDDTRCHWKDRIVKIESIKSGSNFFNSDCYEVIERFDGSGDGSSADTRWLRHEL